MGVKLKASACRTLKNSIYHVFNIVDLRSDKFRDLTIISQWGKSSTIYKYLSDIFQSPES